MLCVMTSNATSSDTNKMVDLKEDDDSLVLQVKSQQHHLDEDSSDLLNSDIRQNSISSVIRLSNSEEVSLKQEESEHCFGEELVTTSATSDNNSAHNQHNQVSSPFADKSKANNISSSPSASSDSGHCSRASPDITSLTATPNGAFRSMASASGESPTDYHHSWGMCGNDVKVDSTSIPSHGLSESDANLYSTSVDHLNSAYTELSPTHQAAAYSSSYFESMQHAYQSPYSAGSAAAAAAAASAFAAGYYPQSNAYGVISQSYSGSRSINSQCKSGSSAALAAQAAYLNPSFSSNFNSTTSQSAQNPYCYGPYSSSFSNSSGSSQSLSNCQQSGFDYSTYSGFSHGSGYSPYYSTGYGGYIPNSSSNVNNSSASSLTLPANSSSAATYQLTQLPQQTDPNLHYHHIDNCPSPIKTETPANSSNIASKKGATKSGRGRGRRQPNPSPDPENNLERVFIWDLDETIIIYLSLLNGTRVTKFVEDNTQPSIYDLGMQLEDLLNRFAENHFFYNDLEDVDQNHVDDTATDDNGQDLSNYNFQTDGFHTNSSCSAVGLGLTSAVRGGVDWLRKMAFRYRRIKEIYTQYRDNVGGLLSGQDRDNLYKIQRKWDALTDNWTLLALKCLQQINSRPKCVNVLVTSIPLVPSLAKVMIFGIASNFSIENIYSAVKIGKENIFERIINRFGKNCTYVVIGDGKDEEMAALKHNLPFWPVSGISDLVAFHHALDLGHL